jgi:hypothetical protein
MRTNKQQISAFDLDIFNDCPEERRDAVSMAVNRQPEDYCIICGVFLTAANAAKVDQAIFKAQYICKSCQSEHDHPKEAAPAVKGELPDFVGIISEPIVINDRVCGFDKSQVEVKADFINGSCPVCHGRGRDGWGKPCRICGGSQNA